MDSIPVSVILIGAAIGHAPTSFESVVAGHGHTCALSTEGVNYCWGFRYGEAPVVVGDGLAFESLTASCGLTETGSAYCWGNNNYGQVGDGTNELRNTPVEVAGHIVFTSVSAGSAHVCGVTTEGGGYCWGFNNGGRLGDGTFDNRSVPTLVAGGLTFESIATGYHHACGVTTGGQAYCWGMNGDGQLGNGTNLFSLVPVAVSGELSFRSLSAGSKHVCGVTTDGAAYCWGGGLLGNGSARGNNAPVAVAGGLSFRSVSAGTNHSCGVTTDERAYCWGTRSAGRLGDGNDKSYSTVPVLVQGGLAFRSVSAGDAHTCGVSTSNEVYCWGLNGNGRLGVGGQLSWSTVPVVIEVAQR